MVQQIEPGSKRAVEIARADADSEQDSSDTKPAPNKANRVSPGEKSAPKQGAATSGAGEEAQKVVAAGHAVRTTDRSKAAPSLKPAVPKQEQTAKLPTATVAVKTKQSVAGSNEKQTDILNVGSDSEYFEESNPHQDSKLALSVIEKTDDGYFDDEQNSDKEFDWDLSEIEAPTVANVGAETAAIPQMKPAVEKPAPQSTVTKPMPQVASTMPVIQPKIAKLAPQPTTVKPVAPPMTTKPVSPPTVAKHVPQPTATKPVVPTPNTKRLAPPTVAKHVPVPTTTKPVAPSMVAASVPQQKAIAPVAQLNDHRQSTVNRQMLWDDQLTQEEPDALWDGQPTLSNSAQALQAGTQVAALPQQRTVAKAATDVTPKTEPAARETAAKSNQQVNNAAETPLNPQPTSEVSHTAQHNYPVAAAVECNPCGSYCNNCYAGSGLFPGVACGPCGHCMDLDWDAMELIPWESLAQGEYIGPPRLPHVPEYRLRVDDIVEFVYRLTQRKSLQPYRINVGDTLRVESLTAENVQRDVIVQPDGTITLRQLGQIPAAGRTLDELRGDLDEQYKKFIREPSITVTPLTLNSQLEELRATVDARAGAGGQTRLSKVTPEGTIQLPAIGSVPAQGLTLDELKVEVEQRYNEIVVGLEITPILSQRAPRFIYVTGEVAQPGRYTLEAPTTLVQAIALAGSWNVGADLENIVILRRDENWQLIATRVDMHKALFGKEPCPGGEIWLRDSDIVLLPKSTLLWTDDLIDMIFTRGIYGVFPVTFQSLTNL